MCTIHNILWVSVLLVSVCPAVDMPPGLQYSNFFFAYVCKKQPLQLPQRSGQKGQLPNGWVAGSKELFSK